MGFVKTKGCSTVKISVTNFKEQCLLDIQSVVEMEEILPQLVFNWDQTGMSIVPGSDWSMEMKGAKQVEITGISDKCHMLRVNNKLFYKKN